jgi:hypothetical protein
MSDLEPRRRSGSGMTRRQREERAYRLVLVTGGLAVLTIALIVLAIVGIVGGGPVVVALLATLGAGFMLRRTLNP